jgi:thiamine-phosphate pyrophosphorylase
VSRGLDGLPFRLLAITDADPPTPLERVRAVVEACGSAVAVLLREPALPAAELRPRAREILRLCRAAGALFLVHADPELALELGADGVHLPERAGTPDAARRRLGPHALIGVSRHDAAGLASTAGADYATISPVFPSPGKGPALGLPALAALCASAPLPLVALGGVTAERALDCLAAGAAAVAGIRAVWGEPSALLPARYQLPVTGYQNCRTGNW